MSAEEIYRQKKKIIPESFNKTPEDNTLERVQEFQKMTSEQEEDLDVPSGNAPFVMSGNIPKDIQEAFSKKSTSMGEKSRATPDHMVNTNLMSGKNPELERILNKLSPHKNFQEVELPSLGKFYSDIPATLHIRPMTGEEESILATRSNVKKGHALDMIFENCIQENIDVKELLSIDRVYLLIFLRAISYTLDYNIEVTCPSCSSKFPTTINLDSDLNLETCPDDFDQNKMKDKLPVSGLDFTYRLCTGNDELLITKYRERRVQEFSAQNDNTVLYRSALLLKSIDKITDTNEILMILKNLTVGDLNHIRNVINDPPFGVDTTIGLVCSNCGAEFEIELPLENANFFFPEKMEKQTQA